MRACVCLSVCLSVCVLRLVAVGHVLAGAEHEVRVIHVYVCPYVRPCVCVRACVRVYACVCVLLRRTSDYNEVSESAGDVGDGALPPASPCYCLAALYDNKAIA